MAKVFGRRQTYVLDRQREADPAWFQSMLGCGLSISSPGRECSARRYQLKLRLTYLPTSPCSAHRGRKHAGMQSSYGSQPARGHG
jgi:hypothetical protein